MLESVFQIRKTKKKCFLKGKHETKKCFQINKENRKNKNCCFSGDRRWCVCPKWSGVAPCAHRQKTALSGLFSVRSKVGGRRLSSSLCRGVVKLDILLFPVDSVPFTRDYECSGGRSVSYLRSMVASHVGSFHSADLVRTLVGGYPPASIVG